MVERKADGTVERRAGRMIEKNAEGIVERKAGRRVRGRQGKWLRGGQRE